MNGAWQDWYAWSRSKQKMFELCERKFFYRYVKFYEVNPGHELKKIKDMKEEKFTNWNFILGDLVHETIEKQIDQIKRGREASKKFALKFISRKIEDIEKNPEGHIIEILNDSEDHKEKLERKLEKIKSEAERQIKIFFDEFLLFYEGLDIITHEEYKTIELGEHTYYVVPDLITRSDDGSVYITDWKTNSDYSNAIDEFQMNMYILWAHQQDFAKLENLNAEFNFLDTGESVDYETTERELNTFKEELKEKSKKLRSKIEAKSNAKDFEKTEKEKICISCIYKNYCENNLN